MKLCLECADGGHLDEMLSLLEAFKDQDIFFVTFHTETTRELGKIAKTIYIDNFKGIIDPAKLPQPFFWIYTVIYLIREIFPSLKILWQERPDAIVSTGGGVTIPLCYLGKLFGAKIIYIESLARIETGSGTGKCVYPVADLFLVQWESLLRQYKKAQYWGKVI